MATSATCRLCLSTEGVVEEIFSLVDPELHKRIYECTNIEIINLPGLPSCICEVCKSELAISYKFRQQCFNTNMILKSIYPELFKNEFVKSYQRDILINKKVGNHDDSQKLNVPEGQMCSEVEIYYNNEYSQREKIVKEENDEEIAEHDEVMLDNGMDQDWEKSQINHDILHLQVSLPRTAAAEGTESICRNDILEQKTDENRCELVISNLEFGTITEYKENAENMLESCKVSDGKESPINKVTSNGNLERISNETESTCSDDSFGQHIDESNHELEVFQLEFETIGNKFNKESGENEVVEERSENREENGRQINKVIPDGNLVPKLSGNKTMESKNETYRKHLMSTDNRLFECKQCGREFRQKSHLHSHTFTHIVEKVFKCKKCNKSYLTPISLRLHMSTHVEEGLALKEHVEQRLTLKEHVVEPSTSKNSYKCDLCTKTFAALKGLSIHKRFHTYNHNSFKQQKGETNDELEVSHLTSADFEVGKEYKEQSRMVEVDEKEGQGNKVLPDVSKVSTNKEKKTESVTYHKHHLYDDKRLFECEQCGGRFRQKSHLNSHMFTHIAEKLFKCNECQKRYTTPVALRRHMDTHIVGGRLKCKYCDKTFNQAYNLGVHIRTHAKEGHKCEYCGKRFLKKYTLKKHMEIHTKERPYKCDVCGRTFTALNGLSIHKRFHTYNYDRLKQQKDEINQELEVPHSKYGTEKLDCNEKCIENEENCEGRDRQTNKDMTDGNLVLQVSEDVRQNEGKHLIDTDKNFFQCKQCGREFEQKSHLHNHIFTHSKKFFECNAFEKSYTTSIAQRQHMDKDIGGGLKCKHCDKSFCQPYNLAVHTRIHFKKRGCKCQYCGKMFLKKFTLMKHVETHTRNRPYKCDVCSKTFAALNGLSIHKRFHTYNYDSLNPQTDETNHELSYSKIYNVGKEDSNKESIENEIAIESSKGCEGKERQINIDMPDGNLVSQVSGSTGENTIFRKHLINTDNKLFQCKKCGQEFQQKSHLHSHMFTHTVEKVFKCNKCENSYNTSIDLRNHKDSHIRERSFKCKHCDKSFNMACNLASHTRTSHSKDKRCKCEYCGKRFLKKINLKKHMETHTREAPYKCDVCAKTFTALKGLSIHKRFHTYNYDSPKQQKNETNHELEVSHTKYGTEEEDCTKKSIENEIAMESGNDCEGESKEINEDMPDSNLVLQVPENLRESATSPKHLIYSSKKKLFECKQCGREFQQKSHLYSHTFTHIG